MTHLNQEYPFFQTEAQKFIRQQRFLFQDPPEKIKRIFKGSKTFESFFTYMPQRNLSASIESKNEGQEPLLRPEKEILFHSEPILGEIPPFILSEEENGELDSSRDNPHSPPPFQLMSDSQENSYILTDEEDFLSSIESFEVETENESEFDEPCHQSEIEPTENVHVVPVAAASSTEEERAFEGAEFKLLNITEIESQPEWKPAESNSIVPNEITTKDADTSNGSLEDRMHLETESINHEKESFHSNDPDSECFSNESNNRSPNKNNNCDNSNSNNSTTDSNENENDDRSKPVVMEKYNLKRVLEKKKENFKKQKREKQNQIRQVKQQQKQQQYQLRDKAQNRNEDVRDVDKRSAFQNKNKIAQTNTSPHEKIDNSEKQQLLRAENSKPSVSKVFLRTFFFKSILFL